MKILMLKHQTEEKTSAKIISFLKSKGVDVQIESIQPHLGLAGDGHWDRLQKKGIVAQHKNAKYDYVISHTHSSYRIVSSFIRSINPKHGVIDLEHDLFSWIPEYFRSPFLRYNAILTFNEKHYDFAKSKLIGREVIKCRWPKVDLDYEPLKFDKVDKWRDGIIIGTAPYGINGQAVPVVNKVKGVRKFWYKNFIKQWRDPSNIAGLPDQFYGPTGIKYCCDACKFIFSRYSSCILEALLFGSIPIILPGKIKAENPIDEILSNVTMTSGPRKRGMTTNRMRGITIENMAKKLDLLRNDQELFESVHNELFLEWFDKDYFSLPSAHEAIYEFISRGKS